MRASCAWALVVLGAIAGACSGEKSATPPGGTPGANVSETQIDVEGTTVARLGSVRVGIGNVYHSAYRDLDGKERQGLVIDLHPAPAPGEAERKISVGEHASFELGSAHWEVVAVRAGSPGGATLRQLR